MATMLGIALVAACAPATAQTDNATTADGAVSPPIASAKSDGPSATTPRPTTPSPTLPNPGAPTSSVPPAVPVDPPIGTFVSQGTRLGVGGCPIFPDDNAFHASIGSLPVRSDSADVITSIGGATLGVRPAFSAGIWQGSRSGVPINVVDSRTSEIVDFVGGEYSYLSDLGRHPLPVNPRYEGWPGIAWDRHLLVVDSATCISSEFFYVTPAWMNPFGFWVAQTAVKIDLSTNKPRARGATTASGLSMLTGTIRYDEVASGRLGHTIAMSIPKIKKAPPVWPAFGTDGRSTDPNAPAMGSWFRLKPDTDLSTLGPQARVVAEALKLHGAVVTDTNSHGMAMGGEPDTRWDDADLGTLQQLNASDFEIIDPTQMIVDPSTMQIR
ncbi:MAG: hypothetical protein WBA45_08710 [Microthrixaceae bacterium]